MGGSNVKKRRLFELEVLPELDVLFNAASSFAHDPDEASDLCEKTMVRAYLSFEPSVIGPGCRAWLLTILNGVVRESEEAAAISAAGASTTNDSASIVCGGNQGMDFPLEGLPGDSKAALVLIDVGRL